MSWGIFPHALNLKRRWLVGGWLVPFSYISDKSASLSDRSKSKEKLKRFSRVRP